MKSHGRATTFQADACLIDLSPHALVLANWRKLVDKFSAHYVTAESACIVGGQPHSLLRQVGTS